jgi:probable F420-dependent oxidoreductase
MSLVTRLGHVGVWTSAWSNALRQTPDRVGELGEAAAELESLGYGTIWLGGSPAVGFAQPLLAATDQITVATGILSIWEHDASDVAAGWADLDRRYPGRFVLGLGVSHGQLTQRYERPYAAMASYLSALDAAAEPVPRSERVLAALGPRMLELSRDRAAGAHPYLVTVEHTAQARATLGPDAVLAPEFKVVLDQDLDRARATARGYLLGYLGMPNYTNNFLRLGFTEEDFRDGGSDRLLDAVFALGEVDVAVTKVEALRAAGADHVAIQVVTDDSRLTLPRAQWRRLAEALALTPR